MNYSKLKETLVDSGIMTQKDFSKYLRRLGLSVVTYGFFISYLVSVAFSVNFVIAVLLMLVGVFFYSLYVSANEPTIIPTINKFVRTWWVGIILFIVAFVLFKVYRIA